MGIVIVGVSAAVLGWVFMREGLLSGAMMLVAVFLGAAAGLGFGPGVAGLLGAERPVHYGLVILLLGIVSCGIIRALLVPLDADIDFHRGTDRIGGAAAGAVCGMLIGGFVCAALLCLNLSFLAGFDSGLRGAAAVIVKPCVVVSHLTPGAYPFDLDTIISRHPPQPE